MKIKFIKPFRLYNPIGDDMMMDEGTIENMDKEDYAQWLIDNGFAEEVKESGWWKPKSDEKYYFLSNVGDIIDEPWLGGMVDESRYSVGNCFKTEEAAERYLNYLKAIATVRQDEGVMTLDQVIRTANEGTMVGQLIVDDRTRNLVASVCSLYSAYPSVGTIYFDTREHVEASLYKHLDEWKIIADYDWSRE